MADYSKLSDDELMAMVQPKAPAQDYSKMSDVDLLKLAQPPERGVVDKLIGQTGPRYQTWPERVVRGAASSVASAASLPGQVMEESQQPKNQISDSDVSVMSVPRVLEMGALAVSPNPGVASGDRAFAGVGRALSPVKPVVPTTEELAKAGGADIQAAKTSQLDISPTAISSYSQKVQQDLFNGGIHPVDAPATFAKLKELENIPPKALFTPGGLQSLRESLQATAQNFNPAAAKDQLAASRAIKQFDQFLPSLDPKDVVARAATSETVPATREQLVGRAFEGKREAGRIADQFERGRGNYAAAMRSNDITGVLDRANTGILERAEARAQASNSGRNIDNTIRQKIASALEKPKEISGLSDQELSAMNDAMAGGAGRNTARYIGNLLGGGGGVGQSVMAGLGAGAGASVGGIPGAIVGASIPATLGATSKGIANQLAKRSLRGVDELMRTRSPLYKERVENPEMSVMSPAGRSAIARLLLGLQANQQ